MAVPQRPRRCGSFAKIGNSDNLHMSSAVPVVAGYNSPSSRALNALLDDTGDDRFDSTPQVRSPPVPVVPRSGAPPQRPPPPFHSIQALTRFCSSTPTSQTMHPSNILETNSLTTTQTIHHPTTQTQQQKHSNHYDFCSNTIHVDIHQHHVASLPSALSALSSSSDHGIGQYSNGFENDFVCDRNTSAKLVASFIAGKNDVKVCVYVCMYNLPF